MHEERIVNPMGRPYLPHVVADGNGSVTYEFAPAIAAVTALTFDRASIREPVWYVLNVAAHCEPQVSKFLSHEGVEAYLPQFPSRPRSKPGSVRETRSRFVFPGYLFFRVPNGFGHWDAIRWAPGVRRILQQDGAPAMISDEVVTHIRRRLAEGLLRPAAPRFKKGDPVTIERGPLAEVDAIFDRELGAPERVQVLINMMERLIPVRIDLEDLHQAPAQPARLPLNAGFLTAFGSGSRLR